MLYEIEHSEDSQIVNELAKTIFLGLGLGLGLREGGRIDVKMNSYGQCFFMKAKLVPGMLIIKVIFQRHVR
jgi:hypothetical protein